MALNFKDLVSGAIFTSHLIEKRIDKALLESFPSQTAPSLLKTLKRICSHSRRYILEYSRDFQSAPLETANLIRTISYFLRSFIAPDIRFAEGANTERTPGSFVRGLEKFVQDQKLLPDSEFILRPQRHYNYKIFELRKNYETILQNYMEIDVVKELFKNLKDNLYIVSFPGFQRDNLFAKILIGHEIGHPIADEYFEQESEDYTYEIGEKVEEEFADGWEERRLSEDDQDREKAEKIHDIISTRKGLLSEIISDLILSHFFNIASLFALVNFIHSAPSLDTPGLVKNNQHPAVNRHPKLTHYRRPKLTHPSA